jgi:hypothetical protein
VDTNSWILIIGAIFLGLQQLYKMYLDSKTAEEVRKRDKAAEEQAIVLANQLKAEASAAKTATVAAAVAAKTAAVEASATKAVVVKTQAAVVAAAESAKVEASAAKVEASAAKAAVVEAQTALAENTAITQDVAQTVNGTRTEMLARIEALTRENDGLRGRPAPPPAKG